eukprot:CAMPEP_0173316276 /NCGR_PEP_ID=MMETSP1143-20121109/26414_1 /TAXON_ID=483371 /ORGANISM="non described non described, Strain CCMP2298" /LENGTH=41 /DNA_ID= /DNA_START= /DNA_END= /DNA_ORIENTATION=
MSDSAHKAGLKLLQRFQEEKGSAQKRSSPHSPYTPHTPHTP